MFDVPVNCKYIKKADHILKSSEDIQSSCDTLFVILWTIEIKEDF